jgi:hypothetical protein
VNEIGLVFQTREKEKSLELPLGFDYAQPDGEKIYITLSLTENFKLNENYSTKSH